MATKYPPGFIQRGVLGVLFTIPALWNRVWAKHWEVGVIIHTWGIRLLFPGPVQLCIFFENPFRKPKEPAC
jgi:hypothetical protein